MKLTELSTAGGCGCKVPPSLLQSIIDITSSQTLNSNVIVGNKCNDDAAIYQIDNDFLSVNTLDFFSPVVNDSYDYGKISAANALSDVYAMGGQPLFALSILAIPKEFPKDELKSIINGAMDICNSSGVNIIGGHSIFNPQPLFGLSVCGKVKINHLKKNTGAQHGDLIYLTKPIGSGILSTAIKLGKIEAIDEREVIKVMGQLNKIGQEIGLLDYVSAMTDVTGFGLLGHLLEVCKCNSLAAFLYFNKIPFIKGINKYVPLIETSGGKRNWQSYKRFINPIPQNTRIMLSDPQTNGGLMVFVKKDYKEVFEKFLKKNGLDLYSNPIGQLVRPLNEEKLIDVLEG